MAVSGFLGVDGGRPAGAADSMNGYWPPYSGEAVGHRPDGVGTGARPGSVPSGKGVGTPDKFPQSFAEFVGVRGWFRACRSLPPLR